MRWSPEAGGKLEVLVRSGFSKTILYYDVTDNISGIYPNAFYFYGDLPEGSQGRIIDLKLFESDRLIFELDKIAFFESGKGKTINFSIKGLDFARKVYRLQFSFVLDKGAGVRLLRGDQGTLTVAGAVIPEPVLKPYYYFDFNARGLAWDRIMPPWVLEDMIQRGRASFRLVSSGEIIPLIKDELRDLPVYFENILNFFRGIKQRHAVR